MVELANAYGTAKTYCDITSKGHTITVEEAIHADMNEICTSDRDAGKRTFGAWEPSTIRKLPVGLLRRPALRLLNQPSMFLPLI